MNSEVRVQKRSEVFISYARKDFTVVNRLRSALEAAGLTTWMDQHNLELGQEWEQEIAVHIDSAHVFLACMSKNAVERKGVLTNEINRAVTRYRGKFRPDFRIIPVRLDDCQLSKDLARFQWFDLDAENLDSLTKLVDSIQSYRGTLLQTFESSVQLPPLSVFEEDIPKVIGLSETRQRAYDCYIRDRIRVRAFEEARDMAKVAAIEERLPAFKLVQQCLEWIFWWEQMSRQRVSWKELGDSLSSSPHLDLSGDLGKVCKPVYSALTDIWRKDLDKSLKRFANLMLTSPNEAIAELQPVLVDSIFALVSGAESSSSPDGLLSCATKVLKLREKKPQQYTFENLIRRSLPPKEGEIEEAEKNFRAIREFKSAADELTNHLQKVAAEAGQELPGVASLQRQLKVEISKCPLPAKNFEFDIVLAMSERWFQGLRILWSEPVLGANLRAAITLLEEAGSEFPQAMEHARLVSTWRKSSDAYLNFIEQSRKSWPSLSEPLLHCVHALESLIAGFAQSLGSSSRPEDRQYQAALDWLNKARGFRKELESRRRLLEALDSWQKDGPDKALLLLEDGTRWFQLCQDVMQLHADTPFLGNDPNLGNLNLGQDILELAETQFEAWLQKTSKISELLERIREEDAVFTCFHPPRFENVCANLRDLAKCRALWSEVQKLFQEGKWTESLPTVIDLVRYFPQAAPLQEILEECRRTETLSWKNLFNKSDWASAETALQSSLAWLKKAREFQGFGGELLRSSVKGLFEETQIHYEMCAPAMEGEKEMEEALGWLESGAYSKAWACLNATLETLESRLPEQLRQEVRRWNEASQALNGLAILVEQP
ncbi:MAG TPA: toll/interleukin-1 receptor domain-containing protein [Candidatus Angelobacter sp.]|nr:toll/interleukin-1 receptor domain-containing protein [Candidatus Angelobacter sp.]